MKKQVLCLLFLVFLPIIVTGQERDWLKRSDLVFQGDILKLFTSTVDLEDPSDSGVVRVTDIIEGNAILRDYLQKPITVRFRDVRNVKPGQTAIFYTKLWISGRGLAVQEIGMKRLGNSSEPRQQKEEIRQERAKLDQDMLRDALKDADHVLTGRVISMKRLPPPAKETEHDPEWTEAEVAVDEGLKGEFRQGNRVKVTFAASKDVMWVRSPKLAPGQVAVFLLRKKVEAFGSPPNFVLIERTQVLDIRRRDEIKKLL